MFIVIFITSEIQHFLFKKWYHCVLIMKFIASPVTLQKLSILKDHSSRTVSKPVLKKPLIYSIILYYIFSISFGFFCDYWNLPLIVLALFSFLGYTDSINFDIFMIFLIIHIFLQWIRKLTIFISWITIIIWFIFRFLI